MIAVIMPVSLVGTVLLIGACAPLVSVASAPNLPDTPPHIEETQLPRASMEYNDFFNRTEVNEDMTSSAIRDMMRQQIVGKSIQILRRHGKSEEEIRAIILNDFHIDAESLEELMNTRTD